MENQFDTKIENQVQMTMCAETSFAISDSTILNKNTFLKLPIVSNSVPKFTKGLADPYIHSINFQVRF